jgi:hypothetical protein
MSIASTVLRFQIMYTGVDDSCPPLVVCPRANSVAGRGRHHVPRPRPVACVVDAEEPRTLTTTHRGQGMATTQIPRFCLCGYFVCCVGGPRPFFACRWIIIPSFAYIILFTRDTILFSVLLCSRKPLIVDIWLKKGKMWKEPSPSLGAPRYRPLGA